MGFNLIYWTPISRSYFSKHSILEKCGIFLKNSRFSGRIWPDWGNTAWADMAGLGSIGLNLVETYDYHCLSCMMFFSGKILNKNLRIPGLHILCCIKKSSMSIIFMTMEQ